MADLAQYNRAVELVNAYPPDPDWVTDRVRNIVQHGQEDAWWRSSPSFSSEFRVERAPVLDAALPDLRRILRGQVSLDPDEFMVMDSEDSLTALSVVTDTQAMAWSRQFKPSSIPSVEQIIYAEALRMPSVRGVIKERDAWPIFSLDNTATSAAVAASLGKSLKLELLRESYPQYFTRYAFDPASMYWNSQDEVPRLSRQVRFNAIMASAVTVGMLRECVAYTQPKAPKMPEDPNRPHQRKRKREGTFDRNPVPMSEHIDRFSPLARPYRCVATLRRKDRRADATMVMLDKKHPETETMTGSALYIPGSDVTACVTVDEATETNRTCTFTLEYIGPRKRDKKTKENLKKGEKQTNKKTLSIDVRLLAGQTQTPHVVFSGMALCDAVIVRLKAQIETKDPVDGFSLHAYYAGDKALNRPNVRDAAFDLSLLVKNIITDDPKSGKSAFKRQLKSYNAAFDKVPPAAVPVDLPDVVAPPLEEEEDELLVTFLKQPARPLWSLPNEDYIQSLVSMGLWKDAVDAACDVWYMILPRNSEELVNYWQRLADWTDVYSATATAFIHVGSDHVQALVRAYRRRRPEPETLTSLWDAFSGSPSAFPKDDDVRESFARSVVSKDTGEMVEAVSSSEAWLDHAMAIEMGLDNDPFFGAFDLSPSTDEPLLPLSPYASDMPLTPL